MSKAGKIESVSINIEEMIRLYHKHDGNHSEIARQLNCSRENVRQRLSKLGLFATYGNLDRKDEQEKR